MAGQRGAPGAVGGLSDSASGAPTSSLASESSLCRPLLPESSGTAAACSCAALAALIACCFDSRGGRGSGRRAVERATVTKRSKRHSTTLAPFETEGRRLRRPGTAFPLWALTSSARASWQLLSLVFSSRSFSTSSSRLPPACCCPGFRGKERIPVVGKTTIAADYIQRRHSRGTEDRMEQPGLRIAGLTLSAIALTSLRRVQASGIVAVFKQPDTA